MSELSHRLGAVTAIPILMILFGLAEAFTATAKIEGKLAQVQGIYALRQGGVPNSEASEIHAQLVQKTIEDCVADLREV